MGRFKVYVTHCHSMCGLQSSRKVVSKLSSPNAPLGYALCFTNLALDGFTNATQDAITKKYIPSFISLSFLHFPHVDASLLFAKWAASLVHHVQLYCGDVSWIVFFMAGIQRRMLGISWWAWTCGAQSICLSSCLGGLVEVAGKQRSSSKSILPPLGTSSCSVCVVLLGRTSSSSLSVSLGLSLTRPSPLPASLSVFWSLPFGMEIISLPSSGLEWSWYSQGLCTKFIWNGRNVVFTRSPTVTSRIRKRSDKLRQAYKFSILWSSSLYTNSMAPLLGATCRALFIPRRP